ncbi:tetratricopeptide repeat protein [Sphingomonas sp. 28-63-12]|uniref:tetratricopeptide repeat protein n=1 Tax=Sphingomonas sp. 28-63-12 TaxID=1970434 RepID=UPI000BD9743E|nr:MAG: hypothetical protein B7Y47_13875 [Sphingomonas sp. 28-63-12]
MAILENQLVNLARRMVGRQLSDIVRNAEAENEVEPGIEAEAEAEVASGNRARDRRAWVEASVHYRQALILRPRWTEIRVQLGNMLKEAGQPAEAESAYRRAIDEMPDNADSYLQLGHALKLQSRHAEARDAYLRAACSDPYLESAQVELRSLGVSQRVIDQHVAAVARRNNEEISGHEAAHEAIDRTIPAAISGWINEIGRDYVAGELEGVDRDSLPLIVVCQADSGPVATCVIEAAQAPGASGVDLASLPRPIPFRIDLSGMASGASPLLRISIGPQGVELVGSPFVLPQPDGAALVERLIRLEEAHARSQPPVDLVEQIERRLSARMMAAVTDQVENLLRFQKETFERELIAGNLGEIAADVLPSSLAYSASDGFPGMGWSPRTTGPGGVPVRAIQGRASLRVPISMPGGAWLDLLIAGPVRDSALRSLTVWANGRPVPFWISPSEAGTHHLYAVFPPDASDGALAFSLHSEDGQGTHVISVRAFSLHGLAVPSIAGADALCATTIGAGSSGAGHYVWPAMAEAARAWIDVATEVELSASDIRVNGQSVGVVATAHGFRLGPVTLVAGRPVIMGWKVAQSDGHDMLGPSSPMLRFVLPN